MLFNSGIFLQFFGALLLVYILVRQHLHARNVLIVVASYFFYGWWDYRFLALLLISSLLDFSIGLALGKESRTGARKWLVGLSVAGNLTLLGFFKYYDFFVSSFAELLSQFGIPFRTETLGIILPVGISFYTFQTMSYTLDIYRGQMQPTRNLVQFLAYVSFFPQLVAGPIERARHLLPQFATTRHIDFAMIRAGVWLCIWGLFKKVVIADNLAPLVEIVYGNPNATGPLVVLGTIAFGFQIYSDFSGYSDMARGLAKLLGFDLMPNFNLPYIAENVREFWRRWHISLSMWLRDYLYFSLGGSRRSRHRTYWNAFVTMLLGGLWHGAAWNFVLWGCWHGAGLVIHRWWSAGRSPVSSRWAGWSSWMLTMLFVFYGWLLFRAGSWEQIVTLTVALADWSLPFWTSEYVLALAAYTAPLVGMQMWQSRQGIDVVLKLSSTQAALFQGCLFIPIVLFWEKQHLPFIYFQF